MNAKPHGHGVVLLETDAKTRAGIEEAVRKTFPSLTLASTDSVDEAMAAVLTLRPQVVICGLGGRSMREYGFLRRVGECAPGTQKILLTTSACDRPWLNRLGVLVALGEPASPATLVDIIGGLCYGSVPEARTHLEGLA